ncbi:hypothetical protein SUDANB58_05803 (plasmid) [Streptomyces sp. enrichment culture]
MQHVDSRVPPSWAKPGNRWGPWIYWPMLCFSIALLAWRVIDGDGPGPIILAAGQVLLWACLLAANRTARRKGM